MGKYDIVSDGLVKTLVIKDLKEDEQGTFGVKVGNKTTNAKLHVQGLCRVTKMILKVCVLIFSFQ